MRVCEMPASSKASSILSRCCVHCPRQLSSCNATTRLAEDEGLGAVAAGTDDVEDLDQLAKLDRRESGLLDQLERLVDGGVVLVNALGLVDEQRRGFGVVLGLGIVRGVAPGVVRDVVAGVALAVVTLDRLAKLVVVVQRRRTELVLATGFAQILQGQMRR